MHLFRHNNNFLPVLGLSLLVSVVFWNAIPHEFVWDDHIFTTYKDAYKNFDMVTILFSLANGLEYQPVRDITYALDFVMWGNNPAGFHFSNVFYYWLTIIVVYGFSTKLA
jgi:hypothetical protein